MPRGLGRGVKGNCKGRGNSGNLERRVFCLIQDFESPHLKNVFFLCIFCGIFGGFDNVRSRWIWINFSDLEHDGVKEGLNRSCFWHVRRTFWPNFIEHVYHNTSYTDMIAICSILSLICDQVLRKIPRCEAEWLTPHWNTTEIGCKASHDVAAEFALMLSRQLWLTCVIIEQVGQNSASPQQFMHYIAVHAEAKSSSSIVPSGHDRSHVVSSKRACNSDQQRYWVIAWGLVNSFVQWIGGFLKCHYFTL